jgi:hypothetical protein
MSLVGPAAAFHFLGQLNAAPWMNVTAGGFIQRTAHRQATTIDDMVVDQGRFHVLVAKEFPVLSD